MAEDLLETFGFSDGLFLVRESSSIPSAYVLSLVAGNEVFHHVVYSMPDRYFHTHGYLRTMYAHTLKCFTYHLVIVVMAFPTAALLRVSVLC